MKIGRTSIFRLVLATFTLGAAAISADLDLIGVTALRAKYPELNGSGQTVAVAEASVGSAWQVSPSTVGQPESLFRYYDSTHPYGGAGAGFIPALASGHAGLVGNHFFGATAGVSPGVAAVENFAADYFVLDVVARTTTVGSTTSWTPVGINPPIINQSFVFLTTDPEIVTEVSLAYDGYANRFGTLFINGANNGSSTFVYAPGSMYNGITVGTLSGNHSGGVHLVAPGTATSFATPYVSGVATLLRQAAELGHFEAMDGVDPTDARLLKAALLNGATKTEGWSQTETNPLDEVFGAGVVNAKSPHDMLSGGQHTASLQTLETPGSVPTTTTPANFLSATSGWDINTLSTAVSSDAVNHYFFDLSTSSNVAFTATVTWNSLTDVDLGINDISNFDLVLVDTLTGTILWSSHSTTENIEHIYLTGLSGSIFDVQVILRGDGGVVTDEYALVWSWTAVTTPVPESGVFWAIGLAGFLGLAIHTRRPRR